MDETPWQLNLFKWSLKKKVKVKTVIDFMEETKNKTFLETEGWDMGKQ